MAIVVTLPAPWSLIFMVGVLWIYVKFFSGNWGPNNSLEARREMFRNVKLSAKVWQWSLISVVLIVAVIQSGLVITFRVIEFPAEAWSLGFDYSAVPMWIVWLYILLMASVAGITEEMGFRGYMQVPLEKRYGPTIGIMVSSLMFMALHLNQAWAPVVLLHLFLIGVMWGVLAYGSGSLIPGIISHTITDIFNFSYWWTDIAGVFDKPTIVVTGIDSHFIVWIVVFAVSGTLSIWTVLRTRNARTTRVNHNP